MIKYGIDSFIISAPLSVITSILMFSGTTVLGIFILKFSKINKTIKTITNLEFQHSIFGFLLLLLILYPLILFKLISEDFLKIISIVILLLNFYYLFFFKKLIKKKFLKKFYLTCIDFYLVLILVFGYFLISLGPITSADSLDYHSSTAIHIVNFAEYPTKYHWFHSRISGSGEILIALGLTIGAEQYGSLAQFSGLLSIIGLIINLSKKNNLNFKTIIFFLLLFLITPILIFLNSTNKPQLMPIALTSICFFLTFLKQDNLNNDDKLYSYYLVFIMLIEAFFLKYSFVLSGMIIGGTCFIKTINKKNYLKFILLTIVLTVIFFLPFSIWKYINFEQNILYSLFLALPEHIYGYKGLMESISSCGYSCFPVWFLFPRSLNELTNFFGILFIFSYFIRIKDKEQFLIFIAIALYIVVGLFYGQSNPRFFLEPALWFLFLLVLCWKFDNHLFYKNFLKYLTRLQSIFIIIILYYGIFTLLPGSLSNKLRNSVLIEKGNGYSLLNWASNSLSNQDILLSTHRSIAIPKIKTVPIFFINYLDPKHLKSKIFYEEIKNEKPTHIIITENYEKYKSIFNNCIGELAYFKEDIHIVATRNPLIKGNQFDGYIYNFNYKNLPKCVYDPN
ncbi:DUF1420 family protein [Pelagibacterales bacterium SAG-MED02]|nr:DUF1420 family protein [Pelagibacterales bacterium SAG-MED02]